jgi:hypothetical protein
MRGAGVMRVMFWIYVAVIVAGTVFYSAIGLAHL